MRFTASGLENSGNGQGQTQWSFLTGTTGWTHTDKNPWGTKFNYDDPKFQETIKWWAGLADKGYMPKLETTVGASVADAFGAGKAAINTNGSWMIGQYTGYKGIQTGIAPTPKGPDGKRASMFNGLADSIWAGTKNPAASAKWVEYLASSRLPGRRSLQGRCLPRASRAPPRRPPRPSRPRASTSAPSPTHVKDGTTFLFPITENAAKVDGLMAAGHGRCAVRQEGRQHPGRGHREGQLPLQVAMKLGENQSPGIHSAPPLRGRTAHRAPAPQHPS